MPGFSTKQAATLLGVQLSLDFKQWNCNFAKLMQRLRGGSSEWPLPRVQNPTGIRVNLLFYQNPGRANGLWAVSNLWVLDIIVTVVCVGRLLILLVLLSASLVLCHIGTFQPENKMYTLSCCMLTELMGTHQCKASEMVLDKQLAAHLDCSKKNLKYWNVLAFHPGQALPPGPTFKCLVLKIRAVNLTTIRAQSNSCLWKTPNESSLHLSNLEMN